MECVKKGTDTESTGTYSKVSRSWVKLNVTREKKAGKKKGCKLKHATVCCFYLC